MIWRSLKSETILEQNLHTSKIILMFLLAIYLWLGIFLITCVYKIYPDFNEYLTIFDTRNISLVNSFMLALTIIGMVLMILSVLGAAGTIKESTATINVIALCTMILFFFSSATSTTSFIITQNNILNTLQLWDAESYKYDSTLNDIDIIQEKLGCCGANSYLEYTNLNLTSLGDKKFTFFKYNITLPLSCCTEYSNGCMAIAENGCNLAFARLMSQYLKIVGILCVSLDVILFLGAIFAFVLAKLVRQVKSERAVLKFKIIKQINQSKMAEFLTFQEPGSTFVKNSRILYASSA